MNKSLSNKKRAMSASLYSDKKQHGTNPKIQQKRFGRTFTESYDGEHASKGSKARLYTSMGEQFKNVNERIGKAPQQLAQQNFLLKNQLKDLNTKLYLTKSKIESQKKKHLIYAKKLNRQFEKELYWQNEKQNQYLITGIKSQYEKLKQSYEQKCLQFQQLKNTVSSTQMQEMNQYCEALEVQNKILIQNITFLKKNKKRSTNLENYLSPVTKLNSQDIEAILNDYREKEIRYKNKIKKLQQEMYQRIDKESQLIKKIKFLQKLMIEKQNDSYHYRKKVKAVQKQKTKLMKEIKIIQEKILQKEQSNSISLEEVKAQNQRQAKIEKAMFEKVIKQKNLMIEKLEKQIGYLSTLLTHWKPLDQLDRFDRNDINSSSQKDRASSIHNQSIHLHGAPSRQMLNRTKTPMNLIFPEETINDERFLLKSTHNQEFLNKDLSFISLNKDEQSNRFDQNSNREPRWSSKKWTEDAKKCRKVLQNQVEHIGELIKYKMIAHQKSPNDMKQYFSCKLQRSNSSKLEEELITMKQAKETLMTEPFNLCQEEAHLLSRYIIEDQGSQFVFCHQGNQNQRAIVKSIMKNIVGDYTLPDCESCQTKWKDIKRIYCHNMQLVLKSVCPKGIIKKDKFLEIFRSLGIDIEESTKNYLVGKLVEQQNSLSTLKYDILFSPEQRIE